ncbi:MAG TPA: DUF3516 domain-containing protein, partial [Actinomycetaceae bacterium]|nr:DUF3516 domain-containing protein [Actinomycetaceae bacterium]
HAMVLSVLARPGDPVATMYRLLTDNHEPTTARNPHLRRAVEIYRSLRTAGVVEHRDAEWRRANPGRPYVRLTVDLPDDFALNAPLSPFALAALDLLDPADPDFAMDVVSTIEATLDDPRPLLFAQRRAARDVAMGEMKADGMEYEERMAALEEITWPRPLAEELDAALATYRQTNPWVADYELSPKSVVREMVENAMTFSDLIARYQLARSEGIVLRYLTDAYRALRQVVPEEARTPEVNEVIEWLGELVRAVDSSLLDEWREMAGERSAEPEQDEALAVGEERAFGVTVDGEAPPVTRNRHAFRLAVRNALFTRVELLAREHYEALGHMHADDGWDAPRWEHAMAEYWQEYDWLGIDSAARAAQYVEIVEQPDDAMLAEAGVPAGLPVGRVWLVRQTFDDPEAHGDWGISAVVDLDASDDQGGAAVRILAVGPR